MGKTRKLKATVTLSLVMKKGETEGQANDRLYDLMYEGLCQASDHDCEFWIESTNEED